MHVAPVAAWLRHVFPCKVADPVQQFCAMVALCGCDFARNLQRLGPRSLWKLRHRLQNSHLSQPEASVQEIVEDVHRAARFVRHHAKEYGIDPKRMGVFGGSSGGHLALMLATRGGAGDPRAADPVDRESSAVQAAAVFYPVTDLLNLGPSTENPGDGGPPKSFVNSFGPKAADLNEWKKIGREISPIFHVTEELPPVFIAHGDADTLVPLEQSTRFQQKAAELGREVLITVRPGEKHGWRTMIWDAHLFAAWMKEQLRK